MKHLVFFVCDSIASYQCLYQWKMYFLPTTNTSESERDKLTIVDDKRVENLVTERILTGCKTETQKPQRTILINSNNNGNQNQ